VAKQQPQFKDSDKSLNGIGLLAEATPAKIALLEQQCTWKALDANEIVIDLKDRSTDVYFVVKGKLKAMDFLTEDEQVALAELGPGDSFGELAAIDLKVRSARVTTVEPTLLACLTSRDFRHLLFECPGVSLALLKRFAGFIRTLNTRITALSTMSPHQRVFHELLRLSEPNTYGDGSWVILHVPPHAEIAEWIGADKQVVAEAIGNLARDGVIERRHRSLIIRDRARLQRLASQ
jgi:CRP-like cAMP-binding protein